VTRDYQLLYTTLTFLKLVLWKMKKKLNEEQNTIATELNSNRTPVCNV
jgi:hypothetical protein